MNMFVTWAAVLLLACGGGKQATRGDDLDESHVSGDNGDVPLAGDTGPEGVEGVEGVEGSAAPDAGPPAPAVTFRIVNSGSSQISFSQNKGWQPVIFAWSGVRGKGAKPIIMFEKHCTASCDLGEQEVCPYCPQPENNKAAREAQKYEHVEAGASLEVPWDGQAHVYEKTRGLQEGKRKRCECFREVAPPPEQYTVMACGQRLTAKANQRSAYQCIETQLTLPTEGPIVVEFEFPDPPKKNKKKRRGH